MIWKKQPYYRENNIVYLTKPEPQSKQNVVGKVFGAIKFLVLLVVLGPGFQIR